jgi:tRNA A-37 threonylcarbamoyl transferase component Bud32
MDNSEIHVHDLCLDYGEDGGYFEYLLEIEGYRYHLLLLFNTEEPDCAENVALNRLPQSFGQSNEEANDAINGCIKILWPFFRSDYASRAGLIPNETIKLQAFTKNGVIHTQTHDHHIQYPSTEPMHNSFPGITTYTPLQIKRLDEIEMHIFKIALDSNIYCMKTVHRTGREADFVREVSILQHCSHPNIIRLIGLVEADNQEAKIEGMLIEYIENARKLRDITSISAEECERWTSQIKEAVEYLHQRGLVWGDAKAANVLLRENGDAVLIDFGGGYTKGWVDMENQNKARGDLQGLERIISFMKARV